MHAAPRFLLFSAVIHLHPISNSVKCLPLPHPLHFSHTLCRGTVLPDDSPGGRTAVWCCVNPYLKKRFLWIFLESSTEYCLLCSSLKYSQRPCSNLGADIGQLRVKPKTLDAIGASPHVCHVWWHGFSPTLHHTTLTFWTPAVIYPLILMSPDHMWLSKEVTSNIYCLFFASDGSWNKMIFGFRKRCV